jgi:4-hydroxy-3-methylbut-2-en-1-yl diphosphate reductase
VRIVLADSYGMCFGVRDAVELALRSPYRADLTVLGELVHNPEVLRRLRRAGVRIAESIHSPVETGHVMITAHGASRSAVAELEARPLQVIEATCPLVTHAHRMLGRLVASGYFPVVIGNAAHVEVRGLVGDLADHEVLSRPEDIPRLQGRSRIGVVSQTTQTVEYVLEMVDRIRAAFPEAEVKLVDTVCQPTKERQQAAHRLGATCDVVIVIGGRNSNNTRKLAETCRAAGARTHQVEHAAELLPEWLRGAETVGVTAGTSTPEETVREVCRRLEEMAG